MAAACIRCAAPTVEISLFDGAAALTMRSCSNCDHRVWLRGDRPTTRSAVIAAVGSSAGRRSA